MSIRAFVRKRKRQRDQMVGNALRSNVTSPHLVRRKIVHCAQGTGISSYRTTYLKRKRDGWLHGYTSDEKASKHQPGFFQSRSNGIFDGVVHTSLIELWYAGNRTPKVYQAADAVPFLGQLVLTVTKAHRPWTYCCERQI